MKDGTTDHHGTLSLWVVYDHPTDYPGGFIARRFEISAGQVQATREVVIGEGQGYDALADLRAALLSKGLFRMPRNSKDDPAIMESWL